MDKIAEVLKIFIEKHMMPSSISIAGAIAALLLIPEENTSLLRIGNTLFIVLWLLMDGCYNRTVHRST